MSDDTHTFDDEPLPGDSATLPGLVVNLAALIRRTESRLVRGASEHTDAEVESLADHLQTLRYAHARIERLSIKHRRKNGVPNGGLSLALAMGLIAREREKP